MCLAVVVLETSRTEDWMLKNDSAAYIPCFWKEDGRTAAYLVKSAVLRADELPVARAHLAKTRLKSLFESRATPKYTHTSQPWNHEPRPERPVGISWPECDHDANKNHRQSASRVFSRCLHGAQLIFGYGHPKP